MLENSAQIAQLASLEFDTFPFSVTPLTPRIVSKMMPAALYCSEEVAPNSPVPPRIEDSVAVQVSPAVTSLSNVSQISGVDGPPLMEKLYG